MFIGGYEIPRRALAAIGALVAIVVIVVVLLVAGVFSSGTKTSGSPSGTTSGTTPVTTVSAKAHKLTIDVQGKPVIKGYALFVTLTKGAGAKSQTLWLQHVSKRLTAPIDDGDYIVTVNFSPCKGQCGFYHGGVSLPPYHFKVDKGDVSLTIQPSCVKVKYAPGIECSTSKIKRS